MDNIRLFLWFALLGTLWVSYTTWVADYSPTGPDFESARRLELNDPQAREQSLPDLDPAQGVTVVPALETASVAPTQGIRVTTDVLDVLIETSGGDIVRVDLPTYPVDKADPDVLVRLLDYSPDNRWVFQTGLRNGAGGSEANHLANYRSDRSNYELSSTEDRLVVTLEWTEAGPVAARKVYTFHRGSYRVDLDIVLDNRSGETWRGAAYSQMVRLHRPVDRSYTSVDSYSFTGPVLYDGDAYEKLDFDDIAREPVTQTLTNGWYAGIQHHFLAAAAPPPADETRYQASTRGQEYVLTALSPIQEVAPGGQLDYTTALFIGPKLQEQLRATAQDMELTVDYGMLTVLAKWLFWILAHIHDWVGNWGWSIMICTVLIKLVFYKLTATSGRSMAKMRKLAPRMKALQERHKDDRQALSQAMMELYKREKVNPAAGCLPILIQMPFFFAFYWVLIESVEMRQAPFMLWINDLSVRDPFYVLPILMGAAMLFQMRLSPAPPDPVQAKVMQIMPIVFTGLFAFFPAGLVIYWLTNTVLSILQQWRINTLVAREA
jgi:YidC/Oxa1 family membrane protein insertase